MALHVASDRLMVQSAAVVLSAVLSVALVVVALSVYGAVNTPARAREQLSDLAERLPTDLQSIVVD
jgi:membrane protein